MKECYVSPLQSGSVCLPYLGLEFCCESRFAERLYRQQSLAYCSGFAFDLSCGILPKPLPYFPAIRNAQFCVVCSTSFKSCQNAALPSFYLLI